MGKLIWRIFLVAVILATLVPSLAVVSKSVMPLLITLVFGALFLLLEISPSSPGISAIQYLIVRILLTIFLFGGAVFLFHVGLTEFSTPYIPSRYSLRSYLEEARSLLGPTPIAILFFAGGGVFVMFGFRYLRIGKVMFTSNANRKVEDEQP